MLDARRRGSAGGAHVIALPGFGRDSLLFLHGDDGPLAAQPFVDALRAGIVTPTANIVAPTCPGWTEEPVPVWLRTVDQLAYHYLDATFQSQSYIDNATGYYLTADQMRWFWAQYAGQASREDPLLSPVYANDLRRQPPALIITAEFDPLRDDGERYATQLREAGVPVELRRVEGQIHSFMGLIATVPEARECWTLVAERLRAALA